MEKRANSDRPTTDERMWTELPRYQPKAADVDALLARAAGDSLGLDFLLNGELGSVAIWFRTHAFTVIAVRERLFTTKGEPASS
jgi:hypothetical protein